jgi:glycosyltransferase involved in cell wall biosynthesis
MPSLGDSFGFVGMEAMAAGVPVLSTNAGGLTEVNLHGVTGYMCNVGDIKSLSNYGIELLSNENLLKEFKTNAVKQAKKFDIHEIVPQYEALYEKFVGLSASQP